MQQNWIVLIAAGIGALLILQWVVRWWREHQYSFSGKTVLITGGSRGLGLVLARQLVQQGAQVALCARDAGELERARIELEQAGRPILTVPCDVTDQAQVEHLIRRVREWAKRDAADNEGFGTIDVLINNAGAIQVGPMELMILEDYQEAMQIHFWAPLYTTLAVLPAMQQRQAGRIVNISSIGGKVSVPHLLPYSASKFALTGLSQGMHAELAKDGIIVTTVCPGLMRTGSPFNAFFKGQHRKEFNWFSISDSLPVISMSAERAARQILAACQRGEAEIALSLPAQIGAKFHGLFPGVTAQLLSWVNRFLPEPNGIGRDRVRGIDSQTTLSKSFTGLSAQAAERNNQFATVPDRDPLDHTEDAQTVP